MLCRARRHRGGARTKEEQHARTKKSAEATAEAAPAEPKAKLGRLTGFTSHSKRFRSIALPRDVHEGMVERWPEGTGTRWTSLRTGR